jgi:hypothetical protein
MPSVPRRVLDHKDGQSAREISEGVSTKSSLRALERRMSGALYSQMVVIGTAPRCRNNSGQEAGLSRTASSSKLTWTLSPTTTPPPSMGRLMLTPKSLRLMSVVADQPTRYPP